MRLYLVTANESPLNSIWAGSQSEAASARKTLVEQGAKRKDLMTQEVEVPTKKEELIGFLNLLASGEDVVAITQKLTAQ
jgi:hypothetical protein